MNQSRRDGKPEQDEADDDRLPPHAAPQHQIGGLIR